MNLYLFDFDGTITKKDSMIQFARFINRRSFALRAIAFSPFLLMFLIRIINNQKLKVIFLKIFFFGHNQDDLFEKAKDFSKYFLQFLKKDALDEIEKLKEFNHNKILVISASLDLWMTPMIDSLGLELICTKGKFIKGKFRGLATPNCYGKEKVKRLLSEISIKKYENIIVFGDSRGDRELFDIASITHFKPF